MKDDKEENQESLASEEIKSFLTVFGIEGQRSKSQEVVMKRLSKKCREHEPTYVDQNPTGTAYLEGMRSVILMINRILRKDPYEVKQTKAINIERENEDDN